MEAARHLSDLPERIRMRRFTAACEELRPLGVAYVLRRFGQSLDRADAEDAVAEVIIRFHRLAAAGRAPDRLRPAFFSSVKNAALDQLRYRGIRPTAPLEAAAGLGAEGPGPEERAESRDDLARLREAIARIRPRHGEAIVLRFGLDLTVPQIGAHLGISEAAAKKLVLRSTERVRERVEQIDARQFCPQMREIAERSVLGEQVAGIAEEAESAAIRAHLEHCGPCRGFLASLRSDLHELGGAILLGGLGTSKLGLAGRLLGGLHGITDSAHAAAARARLASYRAGGAFAPEGSGTAGLLAGTGQKIAAACTAGAAGAATCLATGIVGPGIGPGLAHRVDPHPTPRSAHVRPAPKPVTHPSVSYTAPEVEVEGTGGEAPAGTSPQPRGTAATTAKQAKPAGQKQTQGEPAEKQPATPEQTEQSEFGFEEEGPAQAAPAPASEAAAPVTQSRTVEAAAPSPTPTAESSNSSGSSGAGGSEEFGFGG